MPSNPLARPCFIFPVHYFTTVCTTGTVIFRFSHLILPHTRLFFHTAACQPPKNSPCQAKNATAGILTTERIPAALCLLMKRIVCIRLFIEFQIPAVLWTPYPLSLFLPFWLLPVFWCQRSPDPPSHGKKKN